MNRAVLVFLIPAIFGLIIVAGCVEKKSGIPGIAENNNAQPQGTNNNGTASGNANATAQQALRDKISICLKEATQAKKDSCLTNLAKSEKNAEPCESLQLLSKDNCYYEVASAAKNIDYCEKIKNPDIQARCFGNTAAQGNSVEACQKIPSQPDQDTCISSVAKAQKNPEYCALIFDPAVRDPCYVETAKLAKNDSACAKVSTRKEAGKFIRDNCYYGVSSKPNGESCALLLETARRADCFSNATNKPSGGIDCNFSDEASGNNCNYWVGTKGGSIANCYELTNDKTTACVETGIDANVTAANCANVQSSELVLRNDCYYNAAKNEADEKTCESITSDPKQRSGCFAQLASLKQDEKICQKISDIADRDSCYSAVALAKGDYTVCESIRTDKPYYTCFAEIASKYSAPSICAEAQRARMQRLPYTGKDYCYKEYAVKENHVLSCYEIKFSSLVKECVGEVEGTE
ncbi:MAG: hypothetical protein AABW99_01810 [archaeon]